MSEGCEEASRPELSEPLSTVQSLPESPGSGAAAALGAEASKNRYPARFPGEIETDSEQEPSLESQTTILEAPTPFSLKATALSHGWHECSPMTWCEGGRCFQVVERMKDAAIRVSVVEDPPRKRVVPLRVTVEAREVDDALVREMVRRMHVVLGLDRDVSEFHTLCREHPALEPVPRIGAGRALRSYDMTENIIKALASTNVNWTQAVKMINRIGQLGPIVPHHRHLNAWPTPREILRAGEPYLNHVCRLGYRTESILEFCENVAQKRFDPASLDEQARNGVSSDELLAQLRSIRGIGPSSGHYLLSFLGRHDRLAIDSATIAHVSQTHLKGKRPTNKQVERVYAPYGKWKHLVYWYEHWLTWGTAKEIVREAG